MLLVACALVVASALVWVAPVAATHGGDTLVSVGGPSTPFMPNRQNEPALAVDANHPNILVAGANDLIDNEQCNAGDPTTCEFTPGVGAAGVYFSFDSGDSWTQPTYTGLTARNCVGPAECKPEVGPIGTPPWYYENGLANFGDPGVAFGPRRGADGRFSWENGSRLYYSTIALTPVGPSGPSFMAVSRTDAVAAAAAGDKNAWLPPVVVSKQGSATFADKGQLWADNAATSRYFGNVYVCWTPYRSFSQGNAYPEPLEVATSTDGGDTWRQRQVTPSAANTHSKKQGWGRTSCTVRTDSQGGVYVFAEQYAAGQPGVDKHLLIKSVDGGASWAKPVSLFSVTDGSTKIDPIQGWGVLDGAAGARSGVGDAPAVDIANGAPTGADATNLMVDSYVDAVDGLNHEHVVVRTSTNGTSWSGPLNVESPGDRGYLAAPALSPDGTDLYVVYNGLTTTYQDTTTTDRGLVGVVLHADINHGKPMNWTVLHRSVVGDPRGSGWYDLTAEFLGDYVYAAATRTYGAGLWTDLRNASVCEAVNTFRQAVHDGTFAATPAVQVVCPQGFGNSDIYGGSYPDPS